MDIKKDKYSFNDFVEIVSILRSPGGCPWDREQTHESLKKYLIEETYEVIDAIDKKDKDLLCEELGDLLLQIMLHSQISKEQNEFNIEDVTTGISKKMISRHVHVFGNEVANNADDVVDIWSKIKQQEKGTSSHTEVMRNLAKALPAVIRAYKIQGEAAKVGFDWDNIEPVFGKINEEIDEIKDVYIGEDKDKIEAEVGDLLFAVINLARHLKVDPEIALNRTNNKFISRFSYMEENTLKANKSLGELDLHQMDALWDDAKRHEF